MNYTQYTYKLNLPESLEQLIVSDIEIINIPNSLNTIIYLSSCKKMTLFLDLIIKSKKNISIKNNKDFYGKIIDFDNLYQNNILNDSIII